MDICKLRFIGLHRTEFILNGGRINKTLLFYDVIYEQSLNVRSKFVEVALFLNVFHSSHTHGFCVLPKTYMGEQDLEQTNNNNNNKNKNSNNNNNNNNNIKNQMRYTSWYKLNSEQVVLIKKIDLVKSGFVKEETRV